MKLTVVLCLCLLATYSCSSVSATGSNLLGRLDDGKDENKVKPFKELIGNIKDTLDVIDSGVSLFGKVMGLAATETSEELKNQFLDRGYKSIAAATQIRQIKNARMKHFRDEMKEKLKGMGIVRKMRKSDRKRIESNLKSFYNHPKEEGTWYESNFVFKAGAKGQANSLQIYFYRTANEFTGCDNFHSLIVANTFDFEMADDIFVISKSRSSMGGNFKRTKLDWQRKDAAIKQADIEFITKTFQATALEAINLKLRTGEVTLTASSCKTFKNQKKPWRPINLDIMDDDATYDFGSEMRYVNHPGGRGGGGPMDDDEYIGNAWNRGWLRHYCAGGPGPGQMAEWLRYCKMAAGADEMEEDDESVGGWHETERMKKILNPRGPGWDEMDEDDESIGGWVKVAGGLIWKDMERGVANGECNGRCHRRLRARRLRSS